jgi:type IV pilus assembly protein PilA
MGNPDNSVRFFWIFWRFLTCVPIPTGARARGATLAVRAAVVGGPKGLAGHLDDSAGSMLQELRRGVKGERGFTLVELLLVILIIGIMAAISIPSFLNQRGKAYDAAAKSNVVNAQGTEEIYATDNNGSYASDTLSATDIGSLASIEPSLKSAPYVTATANGTAGYTLVTTAESTGDVFTLVNSHGVVTKTCTVGSGPGNQGGCVGGTW